jgi:hypothetical protein
MELPPMPAIMDTTMEDSMVDLFGEAGENLAVSMVPPVPPTGPLLLHIAEMQSCGCCTCVAPLVLIVFRNGRADKTSVTESLHGLA